MLLTSTRALADLNAVGPTAGKHADPTKLARADDRVYLTRSVQLIQLFSHLRASNAKRRIGRHQLTAPVKKSDLPARQLRCECLLPLLVHALPKPW